MKQHRDEPILFTSGSRDAIIENGKFLKVVTRDTIQHAVWKGSTGIVAAMHGPNGVESKIFPFGTESKCNNCKSYVLSEVSRVMNYRCNKHTTIQLSFDGDGQIDQDTFNSPTPAYGLCPDWQKK